MVCLSVRLTSLLHVTGPNLSSSHMHTDDPNTISVCACVITAEMLMQDRTIGHQVITLAGAVPAANYLQLPQDKVDSLALTGRFLYLQVLC